MSSIVVFGGGSWGTALAHVLACAGSRVQILLRDKAVLSSINEQHENCHYLPGLKLNPEVTASLDAEILSSAKIVVLAIPCQNLRQALEQYKNILSPNCLLINTAKGLELSSLETMSQIVANVNSTWTYAILSGPSFAKEVVQNKPTAVVMGCSSQERGKKLQNLFATPWFRAYSTIDVKGVELGGAVKNVIAIAAGLSDGLGFGDNARAALISRGLAEMTRLGLALGATAPTLYGLSGLGDLVLTCTGNSSRNRQVGLALAQGKKLEEITANLGSVAEGVKTASALLSLAEQNNVDMPIVQSMKAILYDGLSIKLAVQELFERELKAE